MEIVFVRHAEKGEGTDDCGLSQKGIKQTENLVKKLGSKHFDEIYCSSLKRAIETARMIAQKKDIPPKIEPSLNEFESDLFKTKEEEWSEDVRSQYKSLKLFLGNFTKRAENDKKILIVAHGNTNRLILAILLELELKNLIRFRLLETGISEVYWMPKFGNWRLKYWNDVSHQPKDLVEGKNKY